MNNKKIYYITNSRFPTQRAHGVNIINVCSAMAEQGVEVTLLVPWRINNIKQDTFVYYGFNKNFKIKKLLSIDLFKIEKYIGKLAFWLQLISFYISCFFYLLLQNRKRILYGRDHLVALLSVLGYQTFYECHTIPDSKQKTFFKLVAKAKKIIVINQKLKDVFKKHNWVEENILVAHDGVDLKRFDINLSKQEARQKLDLPQDKRIILYAGHLYKWKGVNTLAQAAKLVENALFYFVGGSDKDILKFTKKYKGLIDSNQIILIPHQQQNIIPAWLKAADILILPNSGQEDISKLYTSPLKMFEYMASQRPIIASNLPSLTTVLNIKNCLFFKADDFNDLASKINNFLPDEVLAFDLATQAYKDVKQYAWKQRVKRILEFL